MGQYEVRDQNNRSFRTKTKHVFQGLDWQPLRIYSYVPPDDHFDQTSFNIKIPYIFRFPFQMNWPTLGNA